MQMIINASVAVAQGRPVWLKNAARVAFLLCLFKGTAWVAMTWLAFRGFNIY